MSQKFSTEFIQTFDKAAAIAQAIKGKIVWFVLLGLLASAYLSYLLYTPESEFWWNICKAVLVFLPVLIWLLLIYLLTQIQQVPELVKVLSYQKDNAMSVVQDFVGGEKGFKFRNLFSLIRSVESQDGFDEVMEATAGITLLVNPFFMLLTFIAGVLIFALILVAILILLF